MNPFFTILFLQILFFLFEYIFRLIKIRMIISLNIE